MQIKTSGIVGGENIASLAPAFVGVITNKPRDGRFIRKNLAAKVVYVDNIIGVPKMKVPAETPSLGKGAVACEVAGRGLVRYAFSLNLFLPSDAIIFKPLQFVTVSFPSSCNPRPLFGVITNKPRNGRFIRCI